MDKQPSFAERARRFGEIAVELVNISNEVHDEAERMAAVSTRFAERRGRTNEKASR